ncbi:peptidylprolyl isomerase [Clostridiaceae bacterium]|nr:peptidylprolyl isomerase [Clostridiaceae bacterium]RKI10202.1 peptidylprolyl isomerase [bacterium 1XD21-70]
MLKKRVHGWLAAMIGIVVALAAGGCGESVPMASEAEAVEGYTDAQIRLVAATERNRYSTVYSDQIWEIKVEEEGVSFQEYLLSQVRHFLEEVKTMNLLADQQQIELTSQEKERLRELAEDYYGSLTEADKAFTGISEEEVYQLYLEYHRAGKLVDELTKDVDMEISDSEAKVITVQEIQVSDNDRAKRIHTQAMAAGEDFASFARAVSEDSQIEKSVGRGERSREYEDAVFILAEGEVSPIVRDGDVFYIVKCINEYDEEATLERKQNLALNRKNQAFRKVYDGFAAENAVVLEGDIWDRFPYDVKGSTTADFFEWYADYME